jgi:Zn-dependent metalloprotease
MGDVTIPIASDGTLRTTHYGVTVLVIDAMQWRLDPNRRYTSEMFRMLPCALAAHGHPGIDVMFHTLEFLDLLRQTTGRTSPVDGDLLVSIVNVPGLSNAFWSGGGPLGHMIYGNGDGKHTNALVGADVVGHELTHALTETLCGLVYQGESGALSESISDCFATCLESFELAKYNGDEDRTNDILGTADWEIGEDVVININGKKKLRDMAHPEACGQPSKYGGPNWGDPNSKDDKGNVHVNSGVTNKFFYLLCSRAQNMIEPLSMIVRVLRVAPARMTMAQFATLARQKTIVELQQHVDQSLRDVGL